jgi:opacity protein-like surface antigen
MKYIKMLGLAAVAAMAFMAFAGSASADVLCKAAPTKEGKCPTASGDYAAGQVFKAKSTNPKLTVVGGITAYVTCAESNVELKNTSTGGAKGTAVNGEITDLTFTNDCTTAAGVSCTVSTTKGYTGTVKALNDLGTGELVAFGNTIRTKVVCGAIFSCEYSPKAAGLGVHITGGNPASVVASEEPLDQISGFGCGSEAKWDATYTLTSPTNLWVATEMD